MIKQFIIRVALAILTITTATANDFVSKLEQRAEQGDTWATLYLARLYRNGEGVKKIMKKRFIGIKKGLNY